MLAICNTGSSWLFNRSHESMVFRFKELGMSPCWEWLVHVLFPGDTYCLFRIIDDNSTSICTSCHVLNKPICELFDLPCCWSYGYCTKWVSQTEPCLFQSPIASDVSQWIGFNPIIWDKNMDSIQYIIHLYIIIYNIYHNKYIIIYIYNNIYIIIYI